MDMLSSSNIGSFNIIGLNEGQYARFRKSFNPEDFEFLNDYLSEPGVTHDLIVSLTDINVITFTRDLILGKVVERSYKYLKLAINNLSKEVKPIDVAIFKFSVKYDKKLIHFDIMTKPEVLDLVLPNIDRYLIPEMLNELEDLGGLSIEYDEVKENLIFTINNIVWILGQDITKTEPAKHIAYYFKLPKGKKKTPTYLREER